MKLFAVSIALIICTAVVAAQTIYARSVSSGFNRDGLLQVDRLLHEFFLPQHRQYARYT